MLEVTCNAEDEVQEKVPDELRYSVQCRRAFLPGGWIDLGLRPLHKHQFDVAPQEMR